MTEKYRLDAYDKDHDEYLLVAKSDSCKELQTLGTNLWQTFDLRNRITGEPIDWLEIADAKSLDAIWVFDSYTEKWKTA